MENTNQKVETILMLLDECAIDFDIQDSEPTNDDLETRGLDSYIRTNQGFVMYINDQVEQEMGLSSNYFGF